MILNFRRKQTPLQQARTYLKLGHYQEVYRLLKPHIAEHPRDIPALLLLGQATLEQAQWETAVYIFSRIIQLSPEHPWASALLGYAALHQGNLSLALAALQAARDQQPHNIAILESLLLIAQRIDSDALRRSVWRDLMALDPDHYHRKVNVVAEA